MNPIRIFSNHWYAIPVVKIGAGKKPMSKNAFFNNFIWAQPGFKPDPGGALFFRTRIGQLTSFEPIKKLTPP
jgi:hypothetical protein